jgi:iron complex transport system substrate-binding protein
MIARRFSFFISLLAAGLALCAPVGLPAQAREIVDMAGRTVTIPDKITKIHSASYPLTLLFYVFAPDLLAAVNMPPQERQMPFLSPELEKLPALGGMPGHGPAVNPEEVMALHPDFILSWLEPMGENGETQRQFGKTGLPIVYVRLNAIDDYPAALKFLGQLLGRSERANELADYISRALEKVGKAVAQIPPDQRVKFYYAESADGLATECSNSFHTEAMRLAGGENINRCEQSTHVGMERISLEQIILGKPSIILALDPRFRDMTKSAPEWRNVAAVAQDRVVNIPRLPFNWLDRPPTFMRALGVQWLANLFYPAQLPLDIKVETKSFVKLFFKVDMTDEDVQRLMR